MKEAIKIIKTLQDAGHYALLVGGCVRDMHLGVTPKDFDIVTSALPDQQRQLFTKIKPIGEQYGVMLVNSHYEVACFRTDTYEGKDLTVELLDPKTHSLEELIQKDSQKRDLTINSIYYDPISDTKYDPQNGVSSLELGLVRFVGDAKERITEDPLRILRMWRFMFRFGINTDLTYSFQIQEYELLRNVSRERIFEEMSKILKHVHQGNALMFDMFLIEMNPIFPELSSMLNTVQDPRWHPEGPVSRHTFLVLQNLRIKTPELLWGALLHDIGKTKTTEIHEDKITSHGHDAVGAKMTEELLRSLKCSNKFIDKVVYLVKNHMRIKHAPEMKKSKLLDMINHEHYEGLKEVSASDSMGGSCNMEWYIFLNEFEKSALVKANKDFEPLVTGRDLIAMGLKSGPLFKVLLKIAKESQQEDPSLTKDDLLKDIKEYINEHIEVKA